MSPRLSNNPLSSRSIPGSRTRRLLHASTSSFLTACSSSFSSILQHLLQSLQIALPILIDWHPLYREPNLWQHIRRQRFSQLRIAVSCFGRRSYPLHHSGQGDHLISCGHGQHCCRLHLRPGTDDCFDLPVWIWIGPIFELTVQPSAVPEQAVFDPANIAGAVKSLPLPTAKPLQ